MEIAPIPVVIPACNPKTALLCKSSSAPESYGTLRHLTSADGNAKPSGSSSQEASPATARAKYVHFAAAPAGLANTSNASTDDRHGGNERTPSVNGNRIRKDVGDTVGRKIWIDKIAAGVAFVSVCIVLVGGWMYVSNCRPRN